MDSLARVEYILGQGIPCYASCAPIGMPFYGLTTKRVVNKLSRTNSGEMLIPSISPKIVEHDDGGVELLFSHGEVYHSCGEIKGLLPDGRPKDINHPLIQFLSLRKGWSLEQLTTLFDNAEKGEEPKVAGVNMGGKNLIMRIRYKEYEEFEIWNEMHRILTPLGNGMNVRLTDFFLPSEIGYDYSSFIPPKPDLKYEGERGELISGKR